MGQGHSGEKGSRNISAEQLGHELALRFAKRCFSPIELYSFKDVFRSLADSESNLQYWREETLCRFLELPDALGAGPVLYQSAAYLGAFPFPSLAPSILSFEALLKVVVIMTQRYDRVLKRGNTDRVRLLYRSLAVFDRRASMSATELDASAISDATRAVSKPAAAGFAVDNPSNDGDEDEDDDELALAALDSLDAIEVFKHGERSNINHAQIPPDNFRRLLTLLIVAAPLKSQESLSQHSERYSKAKLEDIRRTADNILWAFGIEKHPGILYHDFNKIIPNSLPFLFDGCNALFERFLFSKNIALLHRRNPSSPPAVPPQASPVQPTTLPAPLLPQEGEILTLNVLSQLSFFIKGDTLFRRLHPLYIGSSAGFSMGSFESKVFNWRAPTILLVSGTRLPDSSSASSTEKTFTETLPPKRYPNGAAGNSQDDRVMFGAYLSTAWKHTGKECFGDTSTLLFQLAPIHEVFRASAVDTDYASFTKPPVPHSGISFGCCPPSPRAHSSPHRTLGPVSLVLDNALEYGVFTHAAAGGGSFHPSESRRLDWQDRFEIEELEVWGFGGEDEEKAQRNAWNWEEREAERRRAVNIGKGNIEADRVWPAPLPSEPPSKLGITTDEII
ncbi:MAG: hypothetical protein M1825_005162 [Sarcosagium campestre]|nr:MAG: hypothetical protein M1825_005162 [Sarcosagium campestre]